ncbi:hypothetical protein GF402_04430 [Candidatus Fermentibacteria bacterium]|nr:hypothetical protein [Candidatus Fermentibacteria bacterium]
MRYLILSLLLIVAMSVAQTCYWGSFDDSRINYSGGTLTGSAHTTLAGIIEANSGVLADPTSLLTETMV